MKLGIIPLVILILLGLVLGLVISGLPTNITLIILAGAFVFFLTVASPVLIIAFLLVLIPFNMLWLGGGITLLEAAYGVTYILLLVSWITRKVVRGIAYRETGSPASPVGLPLAVFFVVTILSCIIGILRGHPFAHWGSDLNLIMYYALCFVMPDMIKNKKTVYTLFSLMIISMILGVLKGAYVVITNPNPDKGFLGRQHIVFAYTNILGLILFMICTTIAATLSKGRKKAVFIALSFFFGMMQLISFTRSLWIAVIFGLVFLCFVFSHRQKRNFLKMISGCVLLFLLYISVAISLPSRNPLSRWMYGIEKRYESIFTAREETTLITREAEAKEALRKAFMYPFLGNGLGTQITYFRYDAWFGAPTWETTRYIHNAYIYLFLNMGLLGLISFLWLCLSLVKYGLFLHGSLKEELDKAFVLGITCAFLSLLVASLAGPLITSPIVTMWFGFFMGAMIILDRSRGKIT